jgi:hypothetical protein
MMTAMDLPPFTRTDREYIKEYCKVSAPIAGALDMLQGEQQAYFGTLLPTIFVARDTLQEMIEARGELKYCMDLAKALLRGLTKRFHHLTIDNKCQLATAFHPIFRKLGWLPTEKHEDLKRIMQDLVAERLKKIADNCPLTSAVVTHNVGEAEVTSSTTGAVPVVSAYYSKLLGTATARGRRDIYEVNARKIVDTWTGTPVSMTLQDSDFLREQCLIDLFIKYNTPVPSSAGVERLFSQGGDILRPKRSSLKDERFNMLMFMRGNRHHWDTYKEN